MQRNKLKAVKPNIKPTLVILEPKALPIEMPVFPCAAAIAETSISGAEVPKPTQSPTPTISGDIEKTACRIGCA